MHTNSHRTDIISLHPPCSPKNHGFSDRSRSVVRSRSISRTADGDSSPPPSAASIQANAPRSSMVDTSQPAASGSAGGAAYQPSGPSTRRRPAPSGAYMLVNRPILAAGTENAVYVMPSGSNIRLLSTSSSGAPATRSMRMPATVAPVLYRHRSPGWSISGRLPSPAIHISGVSGVGGQGGPSVFSRRDASARAMGSG
jgi:hypothetical protein